MKKLLAVPALALLALVLAAPPAAAEGFGMDLGIHGGMVGIDDGDGNTFLGGAQARFHLFWILAVEGRASYYSDSYTLDGIGSVDVENVPFQVSGMLYPIKLPRFGVYLLGGGTYSNLKVTGTSVVTGELTEKKWSAHAGLGLDVKLSSRVTLNGDVRVVFLDADSVDEALDAAVANYKGDFWAATLGLNFKLF